MLDFRGVNSRFFFTKLLVPLHLYQGKVLQWLGHFIRCGLGELGGLKWLVVPECWVGHVVTVASMANSFEILFPRWNNFKFQPVVSALLLLPINCLYHGMCAFRHARNKLADDIYGSEGRSARFLVEQSQNP